MPSLLRVKDVRFAYHPGRPVVDGVTAALPAGRLCALIGPNAAGKSTLLRILLGQLAPTSGAVELEGRALPALSARDRAARISYVPQRSPANFAFTVEQVVAMGRFARPRDDEAVSRAITACDLDALRDTPYVELSVGQQQRILLARAMAQAAGDGRLMLLDEPGSAMDLRHQHLMMAMLRDFAAGPGDRTGETHPRSVIVVLHDLSLAAQYADVVWLLCDGKLTAAGAWPEVMRPEVLEPVYGVRFHTIRHDDSQRPAFIVRTTTPPDDRP